MATETYQINLYSNTTSMLLSSGNTDTKNSTEIKKYSHRRVLPFGPVSRILVLFFFIKKCGSYKINNENNAREFLQLQSRVRVTLGHRHAETVPGHLKIKFERKIKIILKNFKVYRRHQPPGLLPASLHNDRPRAGQILGHQSTQLPQIRRVHLPSLNVLFTVFL